MTTRKLIGTVVVCAALVGGSVALAQGGPPGGRRDGGKGRGEPAALPDSVEIAAMVFELDEALGLSDEQEEQVSAAYFAHFDQVRAATDRVSGNRDDHRRTMESLRSDFEEVVMSLLTEEQSAVYEKRVANRRPGPRR